MGRFQRKFFKQQTGVSRTQAKKIVRKRRKRQAKREAELVALEEEYRERNEDDPDSGEGDQEHG